MGKNCDDIGATKPSPEMCKLMFQTKSTTSLTMQEFSHLSYNSHSLSTEIELEVETKIQPVPDSRGTDILSIYYFFKEV